MTGKKTISLTIDPSQIKQNNNNKRGFEIEVKKKRRSGSMQESVSDNDILTNDEMQARLNALRNATLSKNVKQEDSGDHLLESDDDVQIQAEDHKQLSDTLDGTGVGGATDALTNNQRVQQNAISDARSSYDNLACEPSANAQYNNQNQSDSYHTTTKTAYASETYTREKRKTHVNAYSAGNHDVQTHEKKIYSAYSTRRHSDHLNNRAIQQENTLNGNQGGRDSFKQRDKLSGSSVAHRLPISRATRPGTGINFANKDDKGIAGRKFGSAFAADTQQSKEHQSDRNKQTGYRDNISSTINDGNVLGSDKSDTRRKSVHKNRDDSAKKLSTKKSGYKGYSSSESKKISKMALNRVLSTDLEERMRSEAAAKRARNKIKNADKAKEEIKVIRDVQIPDFITVSELASRMAVQGSEVVRYLMKTGMMVSLNQTIDADIAELICTEFGHNVKRISVDDVETEVNEIVNRDSNFNTEVRPPIVAVMGHVDHGKTTLLDTLRNTNIAKGESGGITQHVASYQIIDKKGRQITFIDTPGHAAFSKIRGRSAVVTDIIILVVAADDGIKESTIESINYAKMHNIPIVVAINKIDKPNINIDKVKMELMSQEVLLEEYGGDVLSTNISALKNQNIDHLIDTIMLQAEILDLKANPNRDAVGTILESRIDGGKGIVASVIVQNGTLKIGDTFVAGSTYGKVRTMYDDYSNRISAAEPSRPVEVIGFNKSPQPGDVFCVVSSDQKAREIAEKRSINQKNAMSSAKINTIEQMMRNKQNDSAKLKIIIKADVSGSLEAIATIIESIQHEEVQNMIISQTIGVISDSDVEFAKQSGAIIIGFRVGVINSAKEFARINNIKILHSTVIYHITEEIKGIMSGMLAPIIEENYIGRAHVRKIFEISRFGTIAGCYVTDGLISRKGETKIKVKRNEKVVFEGSIRSMKHEKDEIREAKYNHECGILADGYNNFLVDDIIECYEIVEKPRNI